jgi:hypothetical protein
MYTCACYICMLLWVPYTYASTYVCYVNTNVGCFYNTNSQCTNSNDCNQTFVNIGITPNVNMHNICFGTICQYISISNLTCDNTMQPCFMSTVAYAPPPTFNNGNSIDINVATAPAPTPTFMPPTAPAPAHDTQSSNKGNNIDANNIDANNIDANMQSTFSPTPSPTPTLTPPMAFLWRWKTHYSIRNARL